MEKNIVEIIQNYATVNQNINLDTEFAQLQIDSLAFVSLISELEDYYGKSLKDEDLDFTLYEKVGDLLAKFE